MRALHKLGVAVFAVAAIFSSVVVTAQANTADERISVAIIGVPPTLDPAMSTADVVSIVSQHIFETLFTFDSSWQVRPMLAATMPKISDNGTVYTIALRENVKFHDGSTMTAKDVVASLKRWEEVAVRGQGVADNIQSIEALDKYTVQITLDKAYAPLLTLLAFSNSAAVIVPADNIEANGQLEKIIGTGPYSLTERKPDRYILVSRFEDYASRSEPADGYFGKRKQIPDEIVFVPVPNTNTRVQAALAGQYDYVFSVPSQAFDRLQNSEQTEPVLMEDFGWPMFAFNMRQGLSANLKIRQAVEAALAPEAMLQAAFGNKRFFNTYAALYPENYIWHNDAGAELYNQADPEKAAQLLEEAGYNGQPLRILTSHQYEFHYEMAVVAKALLEQAGFNVQLDVVDWATLTQRRANPKLWDIYITHSPFLPDPALNSRYTPSSTVGWDNPEKNQLFAELNSETDQAKRVGLFTKLQQLVWEQVPFYKVGSFSALSAKNPQLDGVPELPWPYFWNASISK